MPTQTFFNLNQEKKQRIIDAVIDELGLNTYEHINIQNIVKSAGIPRGSFYQYFLDKDDLYSFFNDYVGKIKLAYWGDLLIEQLDISFLDRIKTIYMKSYQFGVDYPKFIKIGSRISESLTFKNDPNYKKGLQMAVDIYEGFIKIDQEKGRIRKDINSRLLASFMTEFIQKITLDELLNENIDLEAIEHKVNQLIDIIEKGIN